MYDQTLQQQAFLFRQKAIAGTLTVEDEIAAVKMLSAGRTSAAHASTGAKTKRVTSAKIEALNGDDLLNEMMGGDGA